MTVRIIDDLVMYLETSLNVCVDESDEVVNEMEEISTCTSPMHYPARRRASEPSGLGLG